MMFLSALLRMLRAAYSVVDLPEPVGPVTRIAPYGLRNDSSNRLQDSVEEAEVVELQQHLALVQDADDDLLAVHGRQRRDTQVEGLVAHTQADMRPSCGMRFSAMSRSAMILRRLISAVLDVLRGVHDLVQHAVDAEPHAHVLLLGSMWMSEARSSTAWVMIELTSLTIGASSRAASMSPSSSVSSWLAASLARASTSSSIWLNFWIAASTSEDVATIGTTSRPVTVRMSSSAYTFAGSDIATSSFPSRSPIGSAR